MKTVTIPVVIRIIKLKCSNVLLVYIDYMNIAKPAYIGLYIKGTICC
jgi:hypothetical protein